VRPMHPISDGPNGNGVSAGGIVNGRAHRGIVP
jgi:hypothetical protein